MGNWEKQQEFLKEIKEKNKVSRENLGKFFYDLAKVTYTAMVIGGTVILFSEAIKRETFYSEYVCSNFYILNGFTHSIRHLAMVSYEIRKEMAEGIVNSIGFILTFMPGKESSNSCAICV